MFLTKRERKLFRKCLEHSSTSRTCVGNKSHSHSNKQIPRNHNSEEVLLLRNGKFTATDLEKTFKKISA
ncbi:hypothetical protein BpHYR1_004398 [Brachionus plicatilis]|uniref:Uncharacterized protein n=1 Tax=Brachionus plicatilis TaxID=10195 RepID=A0A3M7PB42_BRAPC|nr:hypothetical protein BpHYR1_004398 [Brachionus plicatilis]